MADERKLNEQPSINEDYYYYYYYYYRVTMVQIFVTSNLSIQIMFYRYQR